jgi:formate dehydrogenase subunit gamma
VTNRVLRFTKSERALHWLTVLAFFSLLISGLVVGRRGSFHNVMYAWHLASAGALVGGVVLLVLAGNRRALGRSTRELLSLDAVDRRWLATAPARLLAGTSEPAAGRFNAGQKLNFLLVCALLAALYISGIDAIVMGRHHNLIFGGHQLATIVASVVVSGHIYMAALNRRTRSALRGMFTGEVDREWAHEHYPRWMPTQVAASELTHENRADTD